jgi:hypothetical protein
VTDPDDDTAPALDFSGRTTHGALAAAAAHAARREFAYALDAIARGGVARLWHPRTGLRLVTTGAELRAWFAATGHAFP